MDKQKLTTLELISSIIANSHNLSETLKSIVLLVKSRVNSEVCSIYLIDSYDDTLVLKATIGLNEKAIDKIKLNINEGLVGEVVRTKKPIMAPVAKEHPAFLYIPATNEEKVTSFLGVPLFDRGKVIGVLTIQTKKRYNFDTAEIKLINTIAGQVSLVIVNAKLLEFINSQKEEIQKEKVDLEELSRKKKVQENNIRLKGIPSAKGVAVGNAHFYKVNVDIDAIPAEKGKDVKDEWDKYLEAVEKSKIQLVQLEVEIGSLLTEEEGKIFHTHLMILEDTAFHTKVHVEIDNGWKAEYAVKIIIDEYISVFNKIEDEYLKERMLDVKDVGNRIVSNILEKLMTGSEIPQNTILIAKTMTATEIASLDVKSVKGIILERGGAISHTSILAKSFGIPVVAGLNNIFSIVKEDDIVAIDGHSGNVYIKPIDKILDEYNRLEKEFKAIDTIFETKKDVKPETKDGHTVTIGANVGLFSEVDLAIEYGAEEIGLYRTEFSFSVKERFPDEDEQYFYYLSIINKFTQGPVTFRILDIGGDKFLPYFHLPSEKNPFLGYKSIRVLFNELNIFKTQIKAILRCASHGNTRMLFPMITNIEEVYHIKRIINECMEELTKEGKTFDEKIKIGAMIEVPSAAIIAERIAKEVDFFSIGTNDLIQYLLAVDRNNRVVAPMYRPLHHAVLITIKGIIETALDAGISVSMCGEMAGNYLYTPLLLGFGLKQFHMSPSNIPMVKLSVLETSLSDAKELANEIFKMKTTSEIRNHLITTHPLDVRELSFHEMED